MLKWFKTKFLSDNSKGSFIKDSIIAMSLRLAGIVSSYVFILMITKNFGPEVWGKFSLSLSFIIFFVLLGKSGFDLALLKFTSSHEAKNERHITKQIYFKGLLFCLIISIILTILLMRFSEEIAMLLFKKEDMAEYIFYSSFIIILHVVFLIHSEGLRGLKKNNAFLFLQFIGIYFFGSIILFFCLPLKEKNDLLPLQIFILSSLIVFLISNYLWLKEIISIKTEKVFSFPLKKILKVSFPIFMGNAMFVILNWMDTLLLGVYQVEESEIGIYSVALKVAGIINLPLLAISGIIASNISEQHTLGNFQQLQKIIKDSTRLIFSASLLVYICFLISPSFFLGFFGQDFIQGSKVLLILSSGFLISSFSGCTDIILQMTDNERLFQNIIIVATIINLLLNLILIPFYGIIGSAIASLVSVCIWKIISVYYIKKTLKLNSLFVIK